MKRFGNLFPRIVAFDNLFAAARRAQSGKRFRHDVLAFNYAIEDNLLALQRDLASKKYRPGDYRSFVILEPKRRYISAAPYRDRVAHHALCNIIEPIFDATFNDSSYANRVGKGTHRALNHFVRNARQYAYCLRADVEKFFPSIDHAILKERFRAKIKCRDTLWLMDAILDNSNEQEPVKQYIPDDNLLTGVERRHRLPIGNLTSQLWANLYLNAVDHRMAARFGGRRYLRYVDDIAVFSGSREELVEAREMLRQSLTEVRLKLHPVKTGILRMRDGVDFLGFRIFPDRIRLRQENLRRTRRRLRSMAELYRLDKLDFDYVNHSIRSWVSHAAYGDTWRIRERIFNGLVFGRT